MFFQKVKPLWIWVIVVTAAIIVGLFGAVILKDVRFLFVSLGYSVLASVTFQFVDRLTPIFSKHIPNLFFKFARHINKHRRVFIVIFLLLIGMRLIIPCPPRGNWYGKLIAHMCEDHAFLRFADGKAFNFHGDLKPYEMGIYEKVGWNKYALKFGPDDTKPWIIHSGWFFLYVKAAEDRWWLHRDFHIVEARRMMQKSQTNAPLAKVP